MSLFENIVGAFTFCGQIIKKTASLMLNATFFLILLPFNLLSVIASGLSMIPLLGPVLAFPLSVAAICAKIPIKLADLQLNVWLKGGRTMALSKFLEVPIDVLFSTMSLTNFIDALTDKLDECDHPAEELLTVAILMSILPPSGWTPVGVELDYPEDEDFPSSPSVQHSPEPQVGEFVGFTPGAVFGTAPALQQPPAIGGRMPLHSMPW